MDNLRTCRINNMHIPIGTTVKFRGINIGKIIYNDKKDSICALNSDIVTSLIKSNEYIINIEIMHRGNNEKV